MHPMESGLKHFILCLGLAFSIGATAASFTPPKNLDPSRSGVTLDNSFTDEAWLVYTYDIDTDGQVINTTIHSSNGVPRVEQAVLAQVNAMRFSPAMRNDKPVQPRMRAPTQLGTQLRRAPVVPFPSPETPMVDR